MKKMLFVVLFFFFSVAQAAENAITLTGGDIPSQVAQSGKVFKYNIPLSSFQSSRPLFFKIVAGTPGWLSFTEKGEFSGTPSESDVGTVQVNVLVTDNFKAYLTIQVIIEVAPANPKVTMTYDSATRNHNVVATRGINLGWIFIAPLAGQSCGSFSINGGDPIDTKPIKEILQGAEKQPALRDLCGLALYGLPLPAGEYRFYSPASSAIHLAYFTPDGFLHVVSSVATAGTSSTSSTTSTTSSSTSTTGGTTTGTSGTTKPATGTTSVSTGTTTDGF